MIRRFFSSLICLAAVADVAAFSTMSPTRLSARSTPALRSSTEDVVDSIEDTDDVTCYVVNDEEIIEEGAKPNVVCTSEPDDVSRHYLIHVCIVRMFCSPTIVAQGIQLTLPPLS